MNSQSESLSQESKDGVDHIVLTFGQAEGDISAELHRNVLFYTADHFCGNEQTMTVPEDVKPFLDKIAAPARRTPFADCLHHICIA